MRHTYVLIVGDFNFPRINWSNWSSLDGDVVGNNFLEVIDDLLLFQHVNTPTRKRLGQVSSILDLVLSDEEHSVSQMVFSDPLGKSDHCMIEFNYLCYTVVEEPHFTKYLYALGNYQDFVAELLKIFKSLSVDEMWSHFHDIFTTLVNEYIPTSDTHNPKVASWMSPTALHKIKLKRMAWMKYKITQNDSDFVAYTQCRNDATKAVRACKRCFEKGIVDRISTNPKYFWKYVNSKLKVKNYLGELQRSHGSFTKCDSEMVNILNDYFGTVFTVEDTGSIPSLGDRCSDNYLATVAISIEDVWNQLITLNSGKSSGPDGCHPHVLREVKEGVVTPLYLIFKKSLEDGKLPTPWKDAIVTALHKKAINDCLPTTDLSV